MQPGADRVCYGGPEFQQLLGNHCLLVDVMDICQVSAEGACLHLLPTRVTCHVARVGKDAYMEEMRSIFLFTDGGVCNSFW